MKKLLTASLSILLLAAVNAHAAEPAAAAPVAIKCKTDAVKVSEACAKLLNPAVGNSKVTAKINDNLEFSYCPASGFSPQVLSLSINATRFFTTGTGLLATNAALTTAFQEAVTTCFAGSSFSDGVKAAMVSYNAGIPKTSEKKEDPAARSLPSATPLLEATPLPAIVH
jgi:hypothetical protein